MLKLLKTLYKGWFYEVPPYTTSAYTRFLNLFTLYPSQFILQMARLNEGLVIESSVLIG
jgi:hypothetical protein